jgi:hypothetical protein
VQWEGYCWQYSGVKEGGKKWKENKRNWKIEESGSGTRCEMRGVAVG